MTATKHHREEGGTERSVRRNARCRQRDRRGPIARNPSPVARIPHTLRATAEAGPTPSLAGLRTPILFSEGTAAVAARVVSASHRRFSSSVHARLFARLAAACLAGRWAALVAVWRQTWMGHQRPNLVERGTA